MNGMAIMIVAIVAVIAGLSTTRLTGNQTTSDGITRPATMG